MAGPTQGYVLASYGPERYLHHAVASATTIRRHDPHRPIALLCPPEHQRTLREHGLDALFEPLAELPEPHRSITGVKHHLHQLMPFERSLFADADMVWCRNPDPLWERLRPYGFTATGINQADVWFGASKGAGVLWDALGRRRARTLRRFGLTHLPRIQSGLMYAQDRALTQRVCEAAQDFLARQDQTHFRSRLHERGRDLESCEWSLAMAMSALRVPVFPWRQGYESPQVDFFEAATDYDPDFERVSYRYFCDRFVHEFQAVGNPALRTTLLRAAAFVPSRGDYLRITPFVLHFGWLHQKQPFDAFAERTWRRLTSGA